MRIWRVNSSEREKRFSHLQVLETTMAGQRELFLYPYFGCMLVLALESILIGNTKEEKGLRTSRRRPGRWIPVLGWSKKAELLFSLNLCVPRPSVCAACFLRFVE